MITLSLPTVLFLILAVLGLVAFVLRRWQPYVAAGAALATGVLSLGLWLVPPGGGIAGFSPLPLAVDLQKALTYNGFVLQMQAANEPLVLLSLTTSALVLALSVLGDHEPAFPALALTILAGFLALILLVEGPVEPVLLTPLLLGILAALGVFVLQGEQLGRSVGPLRTLMPPVLALPFFLLASWYIEQVPTHSQDISAATSAAQLLSIGLLLLLAPVPLHSALPATAESAPPLVTAWLTLLYQMTVLVALFRVVTLYPYVAANSPLNLWLTWAGMVSAVWGGLAAAGASHPGRLWGYALLHDWGLILLMMAAPGSRSWALVLALFGLRAVSMLTAAVGLSQLRHTVGSLSPQRMRGAGSRLPWNSTAFLLGGLGLAGFPLSAGFAGHWAALQLVAELDWYVAAIVLVASGGVVFGFVRLVRGLFGVVQGTRVPQESAASIVVAIGAIVLAASLAVAPQLVEGPLAWLMVAFSG